MFHSMPKRHHYVPVTYLKNFCDAAGQLQVFRKDDPARPFRQRPESTGFERYYYSQFDDEGMRDDDRLEAIFSEIETKWPTIVIALANREAMFEAAPHIITFLSLMRVRVPAFRDLAELYLGHSVHTQALLMHAAGKLPPLPEGFPDLMEKIQVTIDPQKSLEIMARALNDMGKLFATLSFDVLHNASDHAFLTSDNPVIYYDPRVPTPAMRPYKIAQDAGRIELLFPVTTRMVLRGRSRPRRPDIGHRTITDRKAIARINRLICRFGYHTIFASGTREASLIAGTAEQSPVAQLDRVPSPEGGYYAFGQFIFGPRPDKPKWNGPRERDRKSAVREAPADEPEAMP
ncbi:uncharacterized protein DUF4238 [Sphingomonas sp. PP-CE-3A-406]|nr:uncharacterized protein DUF4238 [Sphingomonas sp. PP-CE-3A-406]